ncbi:hypothetical protein DFH08DRAFT_867845 [Mycena albidolilacea]|uniref:Uncharacterized protein n=1 Tax=Mycena albidolilacea TaxID=1033008 RepID=A0AAD7A105_9AGAR|nr:hypothetical protein DFH08DRAFT_867845 [Mycena albidolilacea]
MSASRLHTVCFKTWRTPSAHHDLTLLHLPWTQLRLFSISPSVSGPECPHFPELTDLEVSVTSDMQFPNSAAVLLPRLSQLRLVAYRLSDIGSFLDALHTPALRDLELYVIGHDQWNLDSGGATRPNCIDSACPTYTSSGVCALFRTAPNLKSLTLSPPGIRLVAADFDTLRVEGLLPADALRCCNWARTGCFGSRFNPLCHHPPGSACFLVCRQQRCARPGRDAK